MVDQIAPSREQRRVQTPVARLLAVSMAAMLIIGCSAPATTNAPSSVAPPATGNVPSAAASQPAEPAELVLTIPNEMTSQDPIATGGSESYDFWQHIYDTLTFESADGIEPLLACSWDNPDTVTWRFHICETAKFSDGTPVTAADVVFSFDRMINDPTSIQAGSLERITKVELVDASTVQMTTDSPFAAFPGILTSRSILSKANYESMGAEAASKAAVGSGPYKLVEWRPGERYVMELRDDYWASDIAPKAHASVSNGSAAQRVVFRAITEPEALVTALINGEVDMVSYLPPQFVSRVDANVATSASTISVQNMHFILNPITEAMKNVKVRQAILHAVDVPGLIAGPLQGSAELLDGPFGNEVLGYTPDLPDYPYDPARARTLLAEAGYGGGVTISMPCPDGQWLFETEVCTAVAGMLAEVGITAEVKNTEWTTYSEQYRKSTDVSLGFELFLIGTSPDVGEPAAYDNWFECSGRTAYCNEDAAKLYDESRGTLDQVLRVEKLQAANTLVMEDAASIFLWRYKNFYAVSNEFTFTLPYPGATVVHAGSYAVNP